MFERWFAFFGLCSIISCTSTGQPIVVGSPVPTTPSSITPSATSTAELEKLYSLNSIDFKSVEQSSSIVYEKGIQRAFRFAPGEQENVTLRSNAYLNDFLSRHPQSSPSPDPLPNVDFANNIGIAVLLAPGGYFTMAEIVKIEEDAERLVVHTVRWDADASQPAPGVVTAPFHLVTISRSAKEIVFAEPINAPISMRRK